MSVSLWSTDQKIEMWRGQDRGRRWPSYATYVRRGCHL